MEIFWQLQWSWNYNDSATPPTHNTPVPTLTALYPDKHMQEHDTYTYTSIAACNSIMGDINSVGHM